MSKLDHIKYMTFDTLMASVESDMDTFADAGMVDRSKYIKIIRKVNAEIGLKINAEKEKMIDIKNHKAELPDDFEYLQLALLCSEPQRIYTSQSVDAPKLIPEIVSCNTNSPCDACPTKCPCGTNSTLCGHCYKIYEYQPQDVTITYKTCLPVKLTKKSYNYCTDSCLNTMVASDRYKYTLDVTENRLTLDGIREGKLYLNYVTDMMDEDGNLIIVDHPLLNDYYEYSVKARMLENYMLNNDADVSQRLKYILEMKSIARKEAMKFADMPEYTEILDYAKAKRNNFYNKYYKMFERA